MKGVFLLIGLCVLTIGIGCSPITVINDYDRNASFRAYRTFDWLENRPGAGEQARAVAQRNPLIAKLVKKSVDEELSMRGLTEDLTDPDLLVVYHVGEENSIDVTDWGYRYSGVYGGWYSRDIDVYHYREGTLIVDLIDAHTMGLVWRGGAQGVIDEKPVADIVAPKISKAVSKIFNTYPPAQ
ncbi:MAG: DUF4136 domain-containing protein [Candidatus Latescibacterota bacterium]|nr:MAG: DUF4136 domain-containing protein [Candidatus Latescibacterota bacterium]